jgi:aldehyde:ferredoxin oxidoreductase
MDNLSSNKIAVIDLGSSEVMEEELDAALVEENIGGAGITTYLFHKFEAEDPIVLGTGLLTGTLVPGSALAVMTAISPRTGTLAHAPFTLYAGMELKYSGFDYLVIKGRAAKPSYLWLHDGIADVESAEGLWGRDVWEATEGVRNTVGDDLVQVLAIGPSGEAGSPLAQVSNNYWASGDHWGFGKSFGEKQLKLLAVRGMGLLEIAEPEGFLTLCLELLNTVKGGAWSGKKGIADLLAAAGDDDFPGWLAPIIHRHKSCFNTPYATNTFVFLDEDPKRMTEPETPEPGFLLTSMPGLSGFKKLGLSPVEVCRILKACARAGLDPRAVSEACSEKGLKDPEAIIGSLATITGSVEAAVQGPFSGFAPDRPLLADFGLPADGSGTAAWWQRRQALAYLFGIHPVFMLMAPELSEEKLMELARVGTGLEITTEKLNQAIDLISG